jgi:hypothetical protein
VIIIVITSNGRNKAEVVGFRRDARGVIALLVDNVVLLSTGKWEQGLFFLHAKQINQVVMVNT